METQNLTELLRVTCIHQYYRENTYGLFSFEPTESGRKSLTSYGLHFKTRKDGFSVVAPCSLPDTQAAPVELTNPFEEAGKLSFVIFNHDKTFFQNYRYVLPEDPPGEYVYYFNNLNPASRTTSLLLEKKGIKETERMRLHSKRFTGLLERDAAGEIIEPVVYDVLGRVVPLVEYDVVLDAGMNRYEVDLSRKEDGIYTFEYNEEAQQYYCARPSFIRRIPLIILEFFTASDIPDDYALIRREEERQLSPGRQFFLHFGDYSPFWRYVIEPVKIHKTVTLKVISDDPLYIFTPEKAAVDADTGPVAFTSAVKIEKEATEVRNRLFRLGWNDCCRCIPSKKYYYCDKNYGIEIDGEFKCREYEWVRGKKHYPHNCPAREELIPVGDLPAAGEVETEILYEGEQIIAKMTVYLIKKGGKYELSFTSPPPEGEFTHRVREKGEDADIEFSSGMILDWIKCGYTVTNRHGNQKLEVDPVPMEPKDADTFVLYCIMRPGEPGVDLDRHDVITYYFVYQILEYTGEIVTDTFTHEVDTGCSHD